jgi:hypothetical protein
MTVEKLTDEMVLLKVEMTADLLDPKMVVSMVEY